MIVVGIVGRIGAGKSTVARLLAERGAEVIDADRLAHEVLAEPDVVRRIAARWPGAVDAAGLVRRPELAREVFGPTPAHDEALRELEGLVHPGVRRRIGDRLAAIRSAADRPAVVVLDVPLLLQTGWDAACDRLLLVACDEPTRRRRLDLRGWQADQREARERAWERGYRPPPPGKTTIVDGAADPAYTASQIGAFWESLQRT